MPINGNKRRGTTPVSVSIEVLITWLGEPANVHVRFLQEPIYMELYAASEAGVYKKDSISRTKGLITLNCLRNR